MHVKLVKHEPRAILGVSASASSGEIHLSFRSLLNSGEAVESEQIFRPVGGAYRVDTPCTGGSAIFQLASDDLQKGMLVITVVNPSLDPCKAHIEALLYNDAKSTPTPMTFDFDVAAGSSDSVCLLFYRYQ